MVDRRQLHDYGCSLKVFRADVVKPLKLYGEMHRFLPAIASEMGVSIAEVVVNHRAAEARRFEIRAFENLSRDPRPADGQISLELLDPAAADVRPHRRAAGPGGFLIAAYLSYQRLFAYESIANRPLLLLAVLLIFAGIQFVTMGLLAEIMSRTYHESQDKPIYVIKEICESPQTEPRPHSLSLWIQPRAADAPRQRAADVPDAIVGMNATHAPSSRSVAASLNLGGTKPAGVSVDCTMHVHRALDWHIPPAAWCPARARASATSWASKASRRSAAAPL